MKKILCIGILTLLTTYCFGQKISGSDDQDSVSVYVSFIAETNGKIKNIKVDTIMCGNCSKDYKEKISNEAIRLVSKMPKFRKHKESRKYILPMRFTLED